MDITTALATSRLLAQQRLLDITANNLANTNTPGFRAERLQFSDFVNPQPRTSAPSGGKTIDYPQDRSAWRQQEAGPLTHTANPFDLALASDGYFTVNTKAGPRLTRDGRFGLLPNGTLADSSGDAVLDTNGKPIQLSPADTQVTIAGDGSVSSENGDLGKIGVVQPADPTQMTAEGGTNFVTSSPTQPVAAPNVVQGTIEESNVQPVLETTRMMDNLRQFQMITQLIQAEGDRQQSAIDKLLPQNG